MFVDVGSPPVPTPGFENEYTYEVNGTKMRAGEFVGHKTMVSRVDTMADPQPDVVIEPPTMFNGTPIEWTPPRPPK